MSRAPLANVTPKTPFKPSAGAHNEFLRVAKLYGQGMMSGDALPLERETSTQTLVKNMTGGPLPQFAVVAIGAPVFIDPDSSDYKNRHCDEGDTPTATSTIAILTGALLDEKIGPATIIGRTPVQVNIVNTSHRYANPTTSTTELTSSNSGVARILSTESEFADTGTQWAVVQLLGGINDGPGHLVVTSTTSVGGRIPARVKIEDDYSHTTWPDGEQIWTWNLAGANLVAGQVYPFTKFTAAQYLGLRQAPVFVCCDADDLCCAMPHPVCMTFASESAELDGVTVESSLFEVGFTFEAFGRQYNWQITCTGGVYSVTQTNSACSIGVPCVSVYGAATSVELPPILEIDFGGGLTTSIVYGGYQFAPTSWWGIIDIPCNTSTLVVLFNGCNVYLQCTGPDQMGSGIVDFPGHGLTAGGVTSTDPLIASFGPIHFASYEKCACIGDVVSATITGPWTILDGVPTAGYSCPELAIDSIVVTCVDDVYEATIEGHVEGGDDDGDTFTATIAMGECAGSSGTTGCVSIDCDPGIIPNSIVLTFARTSGAGGTGDGQETSLNFLSGNGSSSNHLASGVLDGHKFFIVVECEHFDAAWQIDILVDADDDGVFELTFSGTISNTSGTIWTILITGIDLGEGRVYQVGGSYDTEDC